MSSFSPPHFSPQLLKKPVLLFILLAGLCLLLRVLTLEIPDLIDPTESRYAVVAEQMQSSGNWAVPMLPTPEGWRPYFGKPPLHFWLTASAYSVFGVDEWTARLPSFFGLLIIVGLTAYYGAHFINSEVAALAPLICISSGLLFFLSGASVVDVTFSAMIAGAIVGFAIHAQDPGGSRARRWAYLLFVFLALATLTKGPAGPVIVAIQIALWATLTKRWSTVRSLPWLGGLSLYFLCVLPWFYVAERANPGFLRYFLVTETFSRYLIEDYGDRYGMGHVYAHGSAWWMLGVAFLPWTVALIILAFQNGRKKLWQAYKELDSFVLYSLLWGLSPAIFFTFVRQLHAAYVLPGIAGLALFSAWVFQQSASSVAGNWLRDKAKIMLYLNLAFGLTLFPLGYLFGTPTPIAILAVLPLLLIIFIIYLESRLRPNLSLSAGLVATATVAAFTVFTLQGAAQASHIKSTAHVLRYITENTTARTSRIGVVDEFIYSYYFYARAWQEELSRPVELTPVSLADLNAADVSQVIVRKSDLDQVPQATKSQFEERKIIGRWAWLVRNSLISDSH